MTSTKTGKHLIRFTGLDLNLEATMDSGQVFGFEKKAEGVYEGAIRGQWVKVRQNGAGVIHELPLRVESAQPISSTRIKEYFDLDKDLSDVYQILGVDVGARLIAPLRFPDLLRGLRIIRQDPWEALACFIISSNNNVKRIQGIWKNLVRHGSRVSPGASGFPAAEQIARWHEGVLRELGLGYRASFLLSTARFVAANPVCLDVIRESAYDEAVRRVIAFPGIGPKVADCVLLYGFHKLEAFPVDVWILRAMRRLYFKNRKVSEKKIQLFGQKRWGQNAGYVQQYLFHAARTGVLV